MEENEKEADNVGWNNFLIRQEFIKLYLQTLGMSILY